MLQYFHNFKAIVGFTIYKLVRIVFVVLIFLSFFKKTLISMNKI